MRKQFYNLFLKQAWGKSEIAFEQELMNNNNNNNNNDDDNNNNVANLQMYRYHPTETTRRKSLKSSQNTKNLRLKPVIVGALGLIREGMDQNLGKIPGASNINELQKIILLGTAHTKKVSIK